MLGKFENRETVTVKNSLISRLDVTVINSIILSLPSVEVSDINNIDEWQSLATGRRVEVINGTVGVEPANEDIQLTESRFNFRYKSREGKTRLMLHISASDEYYNRLLQYEGRSYDAFLVDRNENLICNAVGSVYKPLLVDSIEVRRIVAGTPEQTGIIGLLIELSKPITYYAKLLIDITSIYVSPVTVTAVDKISSNVITVEVLDACGNVVTELDKFSFKVSDEINGVITVTDATYLNGIYTLTGTKEFYRGQIKIESGVYFGTGNYIFSIPDYSPDDYDSNDYSTV